MNALQRAIFLAKTTNRAERESAVKLPAVGGGVAPHPQAQIPQADLAPFVSGLNLPFTASASNLNPVLNANQRRRYLYVQNQGAVDFYVSFSAPQAGIKIVAGGSHEFVIPSGIHSAVFVYVLPGVADCNGILVEGSI